MEPVIKGIVDAIMLKAYGNELSNNLRGDMIKFNFQTKYWDLAHDAYVALSDQLFGDDLLEHLYDIDQTARLAL